MLDTNICIYIIKKRPKEVLDKFKSFDLGSIGISSITLAELMYGVQKSQCRQRNAQALQEFILPLQLISFDESAAAHYGEIRAHLEKTGKIIGSLDLMIAAHAKSLKVTLVTNNRKEFSRVPGLKIENWVSSR